MARVVRRRKNPLLPILVAFVVLFLIASVLAVMAYNNGQEDAKKKTNAIASRRKIISDKEMALPVVKQIIRQNEADSKASTVFATLNGQIEKVTRKLTGTASTSDLAVQQIESAIGTDTFVLNAIKTANDAIAAEKVKVAALKAELAAEKVNVRNSTKDFEDLSAQFKVKVSEQAAEIQTLTTANTAQAAAHKTALEDNDTTWQEKLTKQEQEVDNKIAKVNELTLQVDKDVVIIDALRAQLLDKKKQRDIDLAVQAAGKIKEVMPDRNVCFIPIGDANRVVRGMTFRVYGPEGIPRDGEGHKAALTVVRVFKTISQCRVTAINDKDPVAIGDLFANVAFDPTRPPVFVVEGRFDITRAGRLTQAGTQEVVSLIKRSGGKVTDKLSVDVDFVVMGPEPAKPAPLEDDAPGPAQKAFELRMEEYNRWQATLQKARSLNVPKLNTKRFLTLTGYDAAKEYKEE